MLAEASMEVELSRREPIFRFTPPLCLMLLYVHDQRGELVWRVMANEVSTVPAGKGLFVAAPLSEASAKVLEPALLSGGDLGETLQADARPLISSIRYGVVPEGDRAQAPAAPLVPGTYDVSVVAKWAHAESQFSVPAA